MKNLLLLFCFFSASVLMCSCTAEPISSESPTVHADDLPNPAINPPVDHGGADRDKGKG